MFTILNNRMSFKATSKQTMHIDAKSMPDGLPNKNNTCYLVCKIVRILCFVFYYKSLNIERYNAMHQWNGVYDR